MFTALDSTFTVASAGGETLNETALALASSELRVRVRGGQQRRARVEGSRNIKDRPLGVTKRHI